jgi:hypothetical protein
LDPATRVCDAKEKVELENLSMLAEVAARKKFHRNHERHRSKSSRKKSSQKYRNNDTNGDDSDSDSDDSSGNDSYSSLRKSSKADNVFSKYKTEIGLLVGSFLVPVVYRALQPKIEQLLHSNNKREPHASERNSSFGTERASTVGLAQNNGINSVQEINDLMNILENVSGDYAF